MYHKRNGNNSRMCGKSHCNIKYFNEINRLLFWGDFYWCLIWREIGFVEVCNSFCFWYNKDTKRAERQLDSSVAR